MDKVFCLYRCLNKTWRDVFLLLFIFIYLFFLSEDETLILELLYIEKDYKDRCFVGFALINKT